MPQIPQIGFVHGKGLGGIKDVLFRNRQMELARDKQRADILLGRDKYDLDVTAEERQLDEGRAAIEHNAKTRELAAEREKREKAEGEAKMLGERSEAERKAIALYTTKPTEAMAMLAPYGTKAEWVPRNPKAQRPRAYVDRDAPMPMQGGSAMPDGIENDPDSEHMRQPSVQPPPFVPDQAPRPRAYQPPPERQPEVTEEGPEKPLGHRDRLMRITRADGSTHDLDPMEAAEEKKAVIGDRLMRFDQAVKLGKPSADFMKHAYDIRFGIATGMVEPGEENDFYTRLLAHDAAMARANRPRGGGGGKPIGDGEGERLKLSTEESARRLAKDVLSAFKFSEVQVSNRKFSNMASQIASGGAALDAVTAGQFVKEAQGGVGTLSDPDMKFFWKKVGGLGVRTEDEVVNALGGGMGPQKRALVYAAVQELAAKAQENLGVVKQRMSYAFRKSPILSGYHDQMVGTYFGEGDDDEGEVGRAVSLEAKSGKKGSAPAAKPMDLKKMAAERARRVSRDAGAKK